MTEKEEEGVVVSKKQRLFVWGCGEDYQLGLARARRELDFAVHQPTEIPRESFFFDDDDVKKDDDCGTTITTRKEEIERVVAGSRNSCVVTSAKELFSWGWNSHETLGVSESLKKTNQKCASATTTGAPREEREESRGNTTNTNTTPTKECVKTPTKATYFTHDTTEELEQILMKDEFVATEIVRVALGGWHALAIDQFGRVHAWGGNEYGQCATEKKKVEEDKENTRNAGEKEEQKQGGGGGGGGGVCIDDRGYANTSISTPITVSLDWKSPKTLIKAKRVACGGMSSFAVTVEGDVYSWGCPVGGVGPNTYHPKKVENLRDCCEIAAGSFHVLAMTKDGTVYSWGHGEYGQLGHQKTGNEATPRAIETLNRKGVVKIRAGGWHSACITAGGQLFTWGRGEYARLGMGDDDCADKITPTEVKFPSLSSSISSSSPRNNINSTNDSNRVVVVGGDEDDEDDEDKYKIVDASLGGSHTIALTSQGQLFSWGRNSLGRLGRFVNGPHSGVPGEVKFPPLPNDKKWICTKLSCGGRHNMALCVETKSKEDREKVLRDALLENIDNSLYSRE